jgi:Flp pilus assembly protein TadG
LCDADVDDVFPSGCGNQVRVRRVRWGGLVLEVSIALPVPVMLAMGVVEYSYFIHVKSVLQEAAQSGARVAIQSNATNATVTSAVTTAMQTAGFGSSGYTVTTNPSSVTTIATGTTTTVTVSATWGSFGVHPLPTSLGGISPARQVIAAATMIRE